MSLCSSCGTQNSANAKFCLECGFRLQTGPSAAAAPETSVCSTCHQISGPTAKFCSGCGWKLHPAAALRARSAGEAGSRPGEGFDAGGRKPPGQDGPPNPDPGLLSPRPAPAQGPIGLATFLTQPLSQNDAVQAGPAGTQAKVRHSLASRLLLGLTGISILAAATAFGWKQYQYRNPTPKPATQVLQPVLPITVQAPPVPQAQPPSPPPPVMPATDAAAAAGKPISIPAQRLDPPDPGPPARKAGHSHAPAKTLPRQSSNIKVSRKPIPKKNDPAPAKTIPAVIRETSSPPVAKPVQADMPSPRPKSVDQAFREQTRNCGGGMSGLFCRQKVRVHLCEKRWSPDPPAGQKECFVQKQNSLMGG